MGEIVLLEKRIKTYREFHVKTATIQARKMAETAGFNQTMQYQIATVASELATNICRYSREGCIIIKIIEKGEKKGMEIIAEDIGPGIEDIEKAMQDGFSTGKSLGIGLPAVKRLMDEFHIETKIGKGTKITVRKWL